MDKTKRIGRTEPTKVIEYPTEIPLNEIAVAHILATMLENTQHLPESTKGYSTSTQRKTGWKKATLQWILQEKLYIERTSNGYVLHLPYYVQEWNNFDPDTLWNENDKLEFNNSLT